MSAHHTPTGQRGPKAGGPLRPRMPFADMRLIATPVASRFSPIARRIPDVEELT
jgi:hypothetical protein